MVDKLEIFQAMIDAKQQAKRDLYSPSVATKRLVEETETSEETKQSKVSSE